MASVDEHNPLRIGVFFVIFITQLRIEKIKYQTPGQRISRHTRRRRTCYAGQYTPKTNENA